MKDLVILVADKNAQYALQGVLSRPQALGIRPLSFEFRTHVGRDGGARSSGVEVLARERARFSHALLVFDFEGCGAEGVATAVDLQSQLDERLSSLWDENARTVVIEPEVDAWLWGAEAVLRDVLKWPLEQGIRDWLMAKGFEFSQSGKPLRPKEALEALVPIHRQPRSSALYEKITGRISLQRCSDQSFNSMRTTLQGWFPV